MSDPLNSNVVASNRAGGVAGSPLTSRKPTPSAEGRRRRELAAAVLSPELSIDTKCDLLAAIAAADIDAVERSLSQVQSVPSQARRPRP